MAHTIKITVVAHLTKKRNKIWLNGKNVVILANKKLRYGKIKNKRIN